MELDYHNDLLHEPGLLSESHMIRAARRVVNDMPQVSASKGPVSELDQHDHDENCREREAPMVVRNCRAQAALVDSISATVQHSQAKHSLKMGQPVVGMAHPEVTSFENLALQPMMTHHHTTSSESFLPCHLSPQVGES